MNKEPRKTSAPPILYVSKVVLYPGDGQVLAPGPLIHTYMYSAQKDLAGVEGWRKKRGGGGGGKSEIMIWRRYR